MSNRPYTPDELEKMRRWRRQGRRWKWICRQLGRSVNGPPQYARRLRVVRRNLDSRESWEPALRALHARGETDSRVASLMRWSLSLASNRRKRLGLPRNPPDLAAAARKALETARSRHGPDVRSRLWVARLRQDALAAGWPGARGRVDVAVLEWLARHGPSTSPPLIAGVGSHPDNVRRCFARLLAAGLLARVRLPVAGRSYRYSVAEPHLSRWREYHHREIADD